MAGPYRQETLLGVLGLPGCDMAAHDSVTGPLILSGPFRLVRIAFDRLANCNVHEPDR